MSKIDIIIPMHNGAHTIGRTLSSLCSQLYTDFSVVIVNDASDDAFEEAIKPFEDKLDITLIDTDVHDVGQARNIGLKNSSSPWIIFLDADDVLMPQATDVLYGAAVKDDAWVEFVSSPILRANGSSDYYLIDVAKAITWVHGKIYNRSFLMAYGILFPPNSSGGEDGAFNTMVNYLSNKKTSLSSAVAIWINNAGSYCSTATPEDVLIGYLKGQDYVANYLKDKMDFCSNNYVAFTTLQMWIYWNQYFANGKNKENQIKIFPLFHQVFIDGNFYNIINDEKYYKVIEESIRKCRIMNDAPFLDIGYIDFCELVQNGEIKNKIE
jgi:glycosyltransferase involved in cell wall biosynthesis